MPISSSAAGTPQDPRIIVALDFASADKAIAMADKLDPSLCRVKVGKELFTRSGPAVLESLQERGFDIFLDLKFHDIPNTTAKAVQAAAELGVWMVNVHASGGQRMMEAARNALEKTRGPSPLLIGVTVLTSMEAEDLRQIGVESAPMEQVERLAKLTQQSGLDGVVCSAQEASLLKTALGEGFLLVTPGIRPVDSQQGDQRRVMTPAKALQQGSDYLVVGRPITRAERPRVALEEIAAQIEEVR